MDAITILLKEYESLRQEILTSMQLRNSTLSFGLATIGAIFTASIAIVSVSKFLSGLVLVLVVPITSIFVLFMWLGEHQRIQRASKFLVGLESRINKATSHELMTWEASLRNQRSHMRYPYYSTVMLLVIISLLSLSVGFSMLNLSRLVTVGLIIISVTIHIVLYKYTVSTISKLRL